MGRTLRSPVFIASLVIPAATLVTADPGGSMPGPRAPLAAGQLLINEVLYDASGPDEGAEFVELVLAGGEPLDLGRVSLERGNGSRAGDWHEAWHGAQGDTLRPGVHYVIGGARVEPPPRAVIELLLQNGPDACRVLVDGVVVDVVGWGALEGHEFFAGEPATDVAAGTSLGRVPDGRTTGNNRADLTPMPSPSPGAPNRRPSPLRLRSPGHRSDAGRRPRLAVEWTLEEDEEVAPISPRITSVEVVAFPCLAPAARAVTRVSLTSGIASSGELLLASLDPGPIDLCLTWVPIEPPQPAGELSGDTLLVAALVGPGPLRVNEFLFRPIDHGPEWIELVNTGADTLRVEGYALADGRLDPVILDGAPWLAPGQLLVVAEEALPGGIPALVLGSRWPALNDFGEPVADRIRILDDAGRTSDDVAYTGDWAPAGVSVERVSVELASADPAAWSASPLGPTPGRQNGAAREFAPGSEFLRVEPAVLAPGARGPVLLWIAVPLRDGAVAVHAMDGKLVRRFSGAAFAGRRFILWDGKDEGGGQLAPGIYLVSAGGEPIGAHAGPLRTVEARATFVVSP